MLGTVPLTVKMTPHLKQELRITARKLGQKPSAAARKFIEEGIARHRPGGFFGSMKGTAHFPPDFDPSEPAFPPKDWADELPT